MDVFERLESNVRSYCRSWPTVFTKGRGDHLYDEEGRQYIDFFSGAGALNYGHNNPHLKRALIQYLEDDGVVHGLDTATAAKQRFLERFEEVILKPRGMNYKMQFPGPTGTNAVEAALKLARKVTGRHKVVGFTNAFHGMTLGSLAVTGNAMKREGAGIVLGMGMSMPYAGYLDRDGDTIAYLEKRLEDAGSGTDTPAAIIVETIQAEGGMRMASSNWMRRLGQLCRDHGIVLIVDDIQVGCGRTGPFFSFEDVDLKPDIICLSKSISGFGLPMALLLLKPELDVWEPGEHNGTFRGHNPAFVTATEALMFWKTDDLMKSTHRKARVVNHTLTRIAARFPSAEMEHRGRGLIQGLMSPLPDLSSEVCTEAFHRGLIIETSGPGSEVVKLLPPLTIDDTALDQGLEIIEKSFEAAIGARKDIGALVVGKA